MEKRVLLTGILAIALVFGAMVIGCKKEKTNNSGEENDGVFILNNIPSNCNGNYAVLRAKNDDVILIGCQSINLSKGTGAAVRISNGSVRLPMWVKVGENYEKYSGNHTVDVWIGITDSEALKISSDQENFDNVFFDDRRLESVTFSNGGATRATQ